ncbi:RNA polymerase III subunit GL b isoform X2 [Phyllopteryx taeniolatus]|uniref:RNA polymerase III subunit GL b isoform X2 n=1 Tax=Phyllopteryx taeniolatus TaxID=161469 RepID=UPI002AD3A6A3|nr:RNA polymerase III subunit GL b isoform X2 [Phyllopteryx taeniolatus]
MSGRGRGRRGAPSCTAVVNRSETLPPSVQLPSPLFPAMEHNPLPLVCSEEAEYLLALKQEFRGAMKTRPGFIQPHTAQRSNADVERYSDKYHNSSEQMDALTDWIPGASTMVVGSKRGQADEQKKTVKEKKEVLLKLETLAGEEQRSSEDEDEEQAKKKDEEQQEVDEEYDEEELEEETDYIMSYFDNGEDFGAESDDNMDEAVY